MKINATIAVFLSIGTLCFSYTLSDTDVYQIVHAPRPDFIDLSNPFPNTVSSFLESNRLGGEEFAVSVLEYVDENLQAGNLEKASDAISMLTKVSYTNTVPYLLGLVKSPQGRPYPPKVLLVLAVLGDEETYSTIQDKLKSEYDEKFREAFYWGGNLRIGIEIRTPVNYKKLAGAYWFDIFMRQLYEEPSLRLRMFIDSSLDSNAKGWRYSEQRRTLLEKWRNEAGSERDGNSIQYLLDNLQKDLSSGQTDDVVLCEGPVPLKVETEPLPDFLQSPSSNGQSTRVPPTDSPAGSTTVSHRMVVFVVAVGMMAVGMIVFGLFRRNKKRKY